MEQLGDGRRVRILEFDVGALSLQGDIKIKFHGEVKSVCFPDVFKLHMKSAVAHWTIVLLHNFQGLPRHYDDCPFYFWFHTNFVDGSR